MAGSPAECDLAVVGGGILGLAVARELSARRPDSSLTVLEREAEVGTLQTAHNSGVIHAGIYYAPGSLKARLCVTGARELYGYCEQRGIPHERCGKLLVARNDAELAGLDELERRGRANGVAGLRRLAAGELRELEPHVRGVGGLYSPDTGVVDFQAVARSLAAELDARGVRIATSCGVESVDAAPGPHRAPAHPGRDPRALRGLLRRRGRRPAGGGGGRRPRPPHRALPRLLSVPAARAQPPRQGPHLPRAGPGAAVPRRAPQPARGRPRLARPERPAVAARGGRPRLAGDRPDGAALVARGVSTSCAGRVSRRRFAAAAAEYVPELRPRDFRGGFAGVRAQARGPRRPAARRLRGLAVRACAPRAQRALARRHVRARAGSPDRRPGG